MARHKKDIAPGQPVEPEIEEQDPALAAAPEDEIPQEEIEDLHAAKDEPQPEPAAPEEDPLAALQKQFDDLTAQKKAADDKLKEREVAEARFRADLDQARRDREAAEARVRDEQRRRAEIERENLNQHKAVLEHAMMASKADVETAKRQYAEAMTNMDYAAAAEAQEKLAEAKYQVSKLSDGYEKLQEQIDTAPELPSQEQRYERQPEPQATDPWESAISNYAPRDRDWLRVHRQDLFNSPQRQQLAQAADITATAKHGIERGSDAYYQFLDEYMGYAEPQKAAAEPPQPAARQQAQPKRGPVVPAAPVSRSNVQDGGAALPYLSPEEKQTARDLGMSFAKYAGWKQKIAGGQTHLRYIHEGN